MLIKKNEVTMLSENIRKAIDGEQVEFRDNKEGALSILKNDIHTLVTIKEEKATLAQKRQEALSKCLADISHQLKTPITSMRIMADLLEGAPPEKQEEFLKNIKVSLDRMEWLVASLLKIAKLDSDTVAFSKIQVCVSELIETATEPLKILLDVKNQNVELMHDRTVFCDKRWTCEAITNLLKNASECSPENTTIRVDCGENPIYEWISVTDMGGGIPREEMKKLFTRFESSKNANGYGIGLPLARAIVRGQNGDIDVDDGGKGKGATFTIKFYK